MKILKDVLSKLIYTVPGSPLETGGILGGKEQIVTHCIFDTTGQSYGSYMPNVRYLNQVIEEWRMEGISFYGIFHTHYPNVDTLSNGDKRYIMAIMNAVGDHNTSLFFPIIIPGSHMSAYRAYKDTTGTHIVCDEIEII